jgi:hypothetical protein
MSSLLYAIAISNSFVAGLIKYLPIHNMLALRCTCSVLEPYNLEFVMRLHNGILPKNGPSSITTVTSLFLGELFDIDVPRRLHDVFCSFSNDHFHFCGAFHSILVYGMKTRQFETLYRFLGNIASSLDREYYDCHETVVFFWNCAKTQILYDILHNLAGFRYTRHMSLVFEAAQYVPPDDRHEMVAYEAFLKYYRFWAPTHNFAGFDCEYVKKHISADHLVSAFRLFCPHWQDLNPVTRSFQTYDLPEDAYILALVIDIFWTGMDDFMPDRVESIARFAGWMLSHDMRIKENFLMGQIYREAVVNKHDETNGCVILVKSHGLIL